VPIPALGGEGKIKVTLMGPDRVAQMCDLERSRSLYRDRDEFLADVVAIQRQMVGELVAAGCDYVQIDEPSYTGYVDPATLERMRAAARDPMKNLERAIAADNAVIAGLEARRCSGCTSAAATAPACGIAKERTTRSPSACSADLKYDRLLLEYDTERAGTFEPLAPLPRGRTAVLGLITTKTGRVETVDELRRRIDDAARHIPLDQLALSPQCGFASGIAGNSAYRRRAVAQARARARDRAAVWNE
jgi:5-methyltetrahydropteroyltriglutamate--homocysteine methyltransferase